MPRFTIETTYRVPYYRHAVYDAATPEGKDIPVPSHFDETIQRKADHFFELLEQLAVVARPMGVSQGDFEKWLPKAMTAVEKARAIIEERRDPPAEQPDDPP